LGQSGSGLRTAERRDTSVREGGGSIVAYERSLETREPALLELIRAYNGDDCRSTRVLRDWLLDPMKARRPRGDGGILDAS
jgi:predicted RecB family nuclease